MIAQLISQRVLIKISLFFEKFWFLEATNVVLKPFSVFTFSFESNNVTHCGLSLQYTFCFTTREWFKFEFNG